MMKAAVYSTCLASAVLLSACTDNSHVGPQNEPDASPGVPVVETEKHGCARSPGTAPRPIPTRAPCLSRGTANIEETPLVDQNAAARLERRGRQQRLFA